MKTENCADVIAPLGRRHVLGSSLSIPKALALPGGRQDSSETLEGTAEECNRILTGRCLRKGGERNAV